ncbi:hypothetical protein NSQ76_20360 [Bacillus sp. FSL M8-0256]|uniref:hypothetical protein n=1 Tax=Bacillus TaxID=1386 RepID=UPI0013B8CA02|nr:hypothetical protein [Bacillus subtilis]KAF2427307.1 hypothetical protein B6K89_03745 [Bacillus subtilis]MEC0312042.1 hypothetical protein [Bacillus subtilis]MEC0363650.1 hypothetical protein [Bacillus subtilis]
MSVSKKTVKLISEDDNIGLFTFEITEEFLKVVLEDRGYQELEEFLKVYTFEQSFEVFLIAEREAEILSYEGSEEIE